MTNTQQENQPDQPPRPTCTPLLAATAAAAGVLTIVTAVLITYGLAVGHLNHGTTITALFTTQAWLAVVAVRLRDRCRDDQNQAYADIKAGQEAILARMDKVTADAITAVTDHMAAAAEAIAEDRYETGRTDGQLATMRAVAEGHLTQDPRRTGKQYNARPLKSLPNP